jgi:hypothetical protein
MCLCIGIFETTFKQIFLKILLVKGNRHRLSTSWPEQNWKGHCASALLLSLRIWTGLYDVLHVWAHETCTILIRIIKYVSDIWKPTVCNGEVDKIHKLRISLLLSIQQLWVFKILGLCKKSINAVVQTAHTRRSRFEYAAKTLKREVIVLVPFYLVYTGNELSIEETLHCQVSFFWRLWGCKQAPRCWSLLCSNHWA